jgi:hypothetical protein
MPIPEHEARYVFELLKAQREGRFPEAYAQYEAAFDKQTKAGPLPTAIYEEIGARMMEAYRRPGGRFGRGYDDVIRWLLSIRRPGRSSVQIDEQIAAIAHRIAMHARAFRDEPDDATKLAGAFGEYVLQAASRKIQHEYADNAVLEKASAAALDGISCTDVRRAVCEWTAHIPIERWVNAAIEGAMHRKLRKQGFA